MSEANDNVRVADAVLEHLSFLGYSTQEMPSKDALKRYMLEHRLRPNLMLVEFMGGAIVKSFFRVNEERVKADPVGYLAALNDANKKLAVSKAFSESSDLMSLSYWIGFYTKESFVEFLEFFDYEMGLLKTLKISFFV